MKQLISFCRKHPLVIAGGVGMLLFISSYIPNETPAHVLVFGGCLLWLWACAVLACWQPISGIRVFLAMGLSGATLLPIVMGIWVSEMAWAAFGLLLIAELCYLVLLIGRGTKGVHQWVHTAEPPAEWEQPQNATESLQLTETGVQEVVRPAANPKRARTVIGVMVCILLAVVGLIVAVKLIDRYQYNALVEQLDRPEIRYNMARRAAEYSISSGQMLMVNKEVKNFDTKG